jgi:hypothetical protein
MAAPKVTHKEPVDVVVPAEIGLTSKQEKFCQLYASDDSITQTECARMAGYSDQYAAVQATKMLKHAKIIERIRDIKSDLGRKYAVTFETHVKKLAEIRDAAFGSGQFAAAVSAEKHRGQAAGLYIDRKEILHGRIDQMSREDVLKEIQKLQQEYPMLQAVAASNLAIDITPIEDMDDEEA